MDIAKVHPECYTVLEIVRPWVTAINPDPGTLEPCKGMDHMDMTTGRFFVGEMPPTSLSQVIIALRGDTPFCSFEIFTARAQVQRDVLLLNKIGEMPLIPLEDWDLSSEWSWGPGPYKLSLLKIITHILKARGWRLNFIELPLQALPAVAPCLCL